VDAQDRTEQFISVLSKEKARTEQNKDNLLKVYRHLTTCQQYVFATGLWQACQQVVTMLVLIKLLQGCHSQLVELQDDNKWLEQLVTSLLSSTTL
jgi:hypothetical protein